MTLPVAIQKAAAARTGAVGRDVDSVGRHVAFWYQPPGSKWRVYRRTAKGMINVLRRAPRRPEDAS